MTFHSFQPVASMGHDAMGPLFLSKAWGEQQERYVVLRELPRQSDEVLSTEPLFLKDPLHVGNSGPLGPSSHPRLVRTMGTWLLGTRSYLVTEVPGGVPLGEILHRTGERHELPLRVRLYLFCEALRSLASARRWFMESQRQFSFAHGNLSPWNVFVTPSGLVKVGGFGMAHLVMAAASRAKGPEGWLTWVAPEVFRGQAPDARSDVYSMGAVLWELLLDVSQDQESLFESPLVGKLLNQSLHPDPSLRFSSVDDFLRESSEALLAIGNGGESTELRRLASASRLGAPRSLFADAKSGGDQELMDIEEAIDRDEVTATSLGTHLDWRRAPRPTRPLSAPEFRVGTSTFAWSVGVLALGFLLAQL